MNDNRRATRARIHLKNLDHNLNCIRTLVGPEKKICVAVKADAYGHGAVEVSRRALRWGVDFLAVATVPEAIILREAGIDAPLILFSIATEREIEQIVEYSLTPFVCDLTYAKKIEAEAARQKRTIQVHLKIDTGMGRIGAQPEKAADLAEVLSSLEYTKLQGVCTHFPVSDSPEKEDIDFTRMQIKIFTETIETIRERGVDTGIIHAANSGAIISHPDAHFDMVRPGICFYGYYPDRRMDKAKADFRPLMEFISRPAFIKKVKKGTSISYGRTWKAPEETWIASIPAGYADGYNRLLSSKARVEIRGKLYPVAGRVCMDQFMINLGSQSDVTTEDEVILFGPDGISPNASDIGEITGTIPYEVTCSINKRVPRDYCE